MYEIAGKLPDAEKFNLSSQIVRAATSIVLNIAEGSTGQSNAEQNRFLGLAVRSYIETVACLDVIRRRKYLSGTTLTEVMRLGHPVLVKLQAFRKALQTPVTGSRSSVKEVPVYCLSPSSSSLTTVHGLSEPKNSYE